MYHKKRARKKAGEKAVKMVKKLVNSDIWKLSRFMTFASVE